MMSRKSWFIVLLVVFISMQRLAVGAVTYWDFSSGNLSAASGAAVMDYRDGDPGATVFGVTDGGITLPDIDGMAASYMYWPTTSVANDGFNVTQYCGNGLLSYSVAMDVLIPASTFSSTSYTGLFNANTYNTNDADLFLYRPTNSATGLREGSLFVDRDSDNGKVWCNANVMQADTWHRVVMTYNENDPAKDVCVYVDGIEVGYGSNTFGNPTLRLPSVIPFFGDNNGDASNGYVSSLAICDFALNASEVASLGAPTAAGLNAIIDQAKPVFPASSSYATAVAASAPLVHLRFDEPAGAALGAPIANSGTSTISSAQFGLVGYPTTQPLSGTIGPNGLDSLIGFEADNKAITFTGKTEETDAARVRSDLIELKSAYGSGGTTSYELDLDKATYAYWIKPFASGEPKVYLLTTPDYSGVNFDNDFFIAIDFAGGVISLGTQGGTAAAGTTNYASTTDLNLSDLTDGEWHLLVATRDGDDAANASLYLDGEAVALGASAKTLDKGYSHRIGAFGSSSQAYLGDLDEVAIWDRVLDASEVSGLYAAASVPEPSTLVLLFGVIGGFLFWRRK